VTDILGDSIWDDYAERAFTKDEVGFLKQVTGEVDQEVY